MSKTTEYKLAEIFPISMSGEWGSDPLDKGNALVLRAADFTKDCKLRSTIGASRNIPQFKLSNRVLKDGDILIEKSGGSPDQPVGRVVFFDRGREKEIYIHSNFLQLLRVAEGFDKKFSYYLMAFLYSSGLVFRYQQQTTGIINLKLENYLKEKVSIPSASIQRRIQEVLSTIDRTITHTEALIEKYQQIKAGLMHDLFTRGIGADGQLRSTREQAPELYWESPIGWIPKEWECLQLKHYVRSAQYGISTSLSDAQTGIPVLRMNNIKSNIFDVADLKYTKDIEAYKIKLKKGDVLYNRTNSMEHVGKIAIWRDELPECSFASYLVRINLHENMILPEFFSHWMSQASSQNALRRYATPAVQQVNINPTNLQKICISCPRSIKEQRQISERIDMVDLKLNVEKKYLDKLRSEKSGLMHDLLTDKAPVNIEEAEIAHG
jgi:type I restriction enzyme, S subunit